MVVTEDMVEAMPIGSVIIDISIDSGGCFETSKHLAPCANIRKARCFTFLCTQYE